MNWFKTANREFSVDFISSNSYGDLRIAINGTIYRYREVSPHAVEQLQKNIREHRSPKTNGGFYKAKRELGKIIAYLTKNHTS